MSTPRKRILFNIRRFGNFIKIFLRNKRGIVGLVIIFFFVVLAVGSDFLTPYNQLGASKTSAGPLAGQIAAPSWLRYLPPALGGDPTLSENMFLLNDSGFSSSDWMLQNGGQWNFSVSSEIGSAVNVQWEATGGYPPDAGDGNIHITFSRTNNLVGYGNVSVMIYKDFDFPYLGPPSIAEANVSLLVGGSTHEEVQLGWDVNRSQVTNVTVQALDVGTMVNLFIQNPSGSQFAIWPAPKTPSSLMNSTGFVSDYDVWENANFGVTSPVPIRMMVPSQGRYRFGVQILFIDNFNKSDVNVSARIDNVALKLYGTSWGLLGTTDQGYDIWSQLVYGSRVSLYAGLVSAILAVVIGLSVGLSAGYLGKVFDELVMRLTDVLLVLPGLPLLIVLFAILGASIENLIILNGFLGWMGFAKLVRSQVLSIKERPYIEAAKASGSGTVHIIVRHVLPNVMGLVYVTLATAVPGAIVAEAALSWLGFSDYYRMSWGRMLQEMQRANAATKWWWVIPPGLCIAAISVAFILLGYALDEVLNPKLRVRR